MLIHDYDDEQTLAEEEAIAIAEGEDPQSELNDLQKAILCLKVFVCFLLVNYCFIGIGHAT